MYAMVVCLSSFQYSLQVENMHRIQQGQFTLKNRNHQKTTDNQGKGVLW